VIHTKKTNTHHSVNDTGQRVQDKVTYTQSQQEDYTDTADTD